MLEPAPVLAYSINILTRVKTFPSNKNRESNVRCGISCKCSPPRGINHVCQYRVLEDHTSKRSPWSTEVDLSCQTESVCLGDLQEFRDFFEEWGGVSYGAAVNNIPSRISGKCPGVCGDCTTSVRSNRTWKWVRTFCWHLFGCRIVRNNIHSPNQAAAFPNI